MNELVQKLLFARPIEYLVIDRDFYVIDASWGVQRFIESPDSPVLGIDVRGNFPELIGLEDVIVEILEDQTDYFQLKGIKRESPAHIPPSFYVDIHLVKYMGTSRNSHLLVLLEDSTERMLLEQNLGQVAKEYGLALSSLTKAKDYIDKIISAMTDVMFIVSYLGQIKGMNKAVNRLFEYTHLELIDQSIEIIFSHQESDWLKTVLTEIEHQKNHVREVEILCKTKTGKLLTISFSITEIQVEPNESKEFVWVGRDITERKKTEMLLRQQAERERLIKGITERIRHSLNLQNTLMNTVAEIRQFLDVDRVLFYRLETEFGENISAESIGSREIPGLNKDFYQAYFRQNLSEFTEGKILAINDIELGGVEEFTRTAIASFHQLQARSHLVIPIIDDTELWGFLVIHHYYESRNWELWEINVLQELGNQIAIAVHQAALYEQLQIVNRELEKLVRMDGLTKIGNRRSFDTTLKLEWRRNAREKNPLSLIIADVDCFKLYNDTYGHFAGDLCLKKVANLFRVMTKRPGDLVARYGGEEFAIILPNTPLVGAIHLGNQILHGVRHLEIPHRTSSVSHYVTISLGIATLIPDNESTEEILIKEADRALYQAKNQGRDRLVIALD